MPSNTLKLSVPTKEIKNALDAILAVSKKIPNDIQPGDAQGAIIRRDQGYSIVCTHDYCNVEVLLADVVAAGDEDEVIAIWDGKSNIGAENVLGIYDMSKLCALLAKLTSAAKEITFSFTEDKKVMHVSTDNGKEYNFDMALPRKIMAIYHGVEQKTKVSDMTSSQFSWFCSALSNLGKIVKPSVSRPGFGCVVLTAYPTDSKTITLSGNSDAEGYSFVYTSRILSHIDFTALLPKNLCEAFGAFFSKIGTPEGDVCVSAEIDDQNRASELVFSSEKFSVSFVCMKDDFPFKAIDGIVATARTPYCMYQTKRDEIKKTVDRLSVFAKNDEAVSEIHVLDGGTVEMIQRKNVTSNDKPARETCSSGVLAHFPEQIPSLGTSVKTDVLKSMLGIVPAAPDMSFVVCETKPGSARRLAILSSDDNSDITAVLLGLRSDIR